MKLDFSKVNIENMGRYEGATVSYSENGNEWYMYMYPASIDWGAYYYQIEIYRNSELVSSDIYRIENFKLDDGKSHTVMTRKGVKPHHIPFIMQHLLKEL